MSTDLPMSRPGAATSGADVSGAGTSGGARGYARGTAARREPALRFAVLGDSLSEGVGDPMPGGGWRGWGALLAEGIGAGPGAVAVVNAARSGACSGDVAGRQLAVALACRPRLASVVVGGNDTLRGGFAIDRVTADLHTAIGELRAAGADVLTACLPDPGSVLGLPWPLARPLARRMTALNTAVHALSAYHGALHLHAAHRPWSTAPGTLSADRLHPSEKGHRLLARDFHAILAARGLAAGPPPRLDPDRPPPGRRASTWWMATRGTRWVADRSRDLLPDLIRLAAEEYRHEVRGTVPLLDHAARRATERALGAVLPSSLTAGRP
ncbi:SGNH/GDSL hydrolase family protein [Streptomyces sp. NBC_00669]|uniref:SGNH/GDSL hydrolase family protein n=1 Tax=Streptomyces sp. NBC_00669 TaxID=2976011 RepID=UPI002E35140E|nr:SGNH/GDSL hydrolase family protein [Streptomyces sp. NBC_00669]